MTKENTKKKKHIKDFSERAAARFLIEQHTIGDLRDEGDLINSQYHADTTINFVVDILQNLSGTLNEKINFLNNIKNEIPKFYGSEKNNENSESKE